MCWTDKHIQWFIDTGQRLHTPDGLEVPVWEFQYKNDDPVLKAWATHFRNHYCRDCEIDEERNSTGLSRRDYLLNTQFPQRDTNLGRSVRAGDFGEILVADFVQHVLKYTVPRTRYWLKAIRDESTHGIDILGFKVVGKQPHPKDELISFEVKCALVTSPLDTLKNALADSITAVKIKKAESLSATRRRLKLMKQDDLVLLVSRFQDRDAIPYVERSGAAAVCSTETYTPDMTDSTDAAKHPNRQRLLLLIVRGNKLMDLVHYLYKRAADEA